MDKISSQMIASVCEIARSAGAEILNHYGRAQAVELKADRSPVTAADRAVHQLIVEALTGATPSIPVVSEESEDRSAEALKGSDQFWLVDPLDGTKEFIKRTGEFTVNIAQILSSGRRAGRHIRA